MVAGVRGQVPFYVSLAVAVAVVVALTDMKWFFRDRLCSQGKVCPLYQHAKRTHKAKKLRRSRTGKLLPLLLRWLVSGSGSRLSCHSIGLVGVVSAAGAGGADWPLAN